MSSTNRTRLLPAAVLGSLVLLSACSSTPSRNNALEEARGTYASAHASPQVNSLAPLELKQAGEALQRAETAWQNDADAGRVQHLAYLARQRASIAQETARTKVAENAVATTQQERDRVQLAARTRDANLAQRDARDAQQDAEFARRQAEAAQRTAAAQTMEARNAQAAAAASAQQAAAASQQAASATQQAAEAEARNRLLAEQLADLAAKKTERGLVVTLGSDVLFDVDQATLNPGGMRTVQKVADFLNRYPERKLMVEGFTDSTGTDAYNLDLSERRANAVRAAVVGAGVDPGRVLARGYGEGFPVASNDGAAGRQLNRRVEVIISNDAGDITPRMAQR